MIKVTVWNEYLHENPESKRFNQAALDTHPNGLHETVAEIVRELGDENVLVRTAWQDQPEHGLTQELLDDTDVLIWWAHCGHKNVEDEIVDRVYNRILQGMGFIGLHSAHFSKIFKKLNGTTCALKWRGDTYERIFTVCPTHPIAAGIPEHFELGIEECYGEFFDIAKPDEVIFQGWFDIGEVFRSGFTMTRGFGKIFYFQPGHETNESFKNPYVRRIIQNAVQWCAPTVTRTYLGAPKIGTTLEDTRLNGADGDYLELR